MYILCKKAKTVLYTGVTDNLEERINQHKNDIEGCKNTFAARYKCCFLLCHEEFQWIHAAIAIEKEIKGWRREKKIELIKQMNPEMIFLNE